MIVIRYIWYYFFWVIFKIGLAFYFKKIKITGIENIPRNAPIVYGANHENAFIDALLLTTRTQQFSHYLVRADVFRKPLVSALLKSFNMLPVYRIRDGFKSLKSNNTIFQSCFKALAKNRSLIMFPEGKHDIRRVPRKLTKGISRIAIGAANSEEGPKSLYVVPVGLNYSDHKCFRSSVHIVYGNPILVQGQTEDARNLDALRTEINEELLNCSIGLQEKYYPQLDTLLFKANGGYQLENPITINAQAQQLTNCIESKNSDGLFNAIEELDHSLDEMGVKNYLSVEKLNVATSILSLILLTPFYLYGLMQNLIPVLIIQSIIGLKVKDKIFTSSIKFSLGLLVFPLCWYMQSVFVWSYSLPQYFEIIYWMSLPVSLLLINYTHSLLGLLWAKRKLNSNFELRKVLRGSLDYIADFRSKCG